MIQTDKFLFVENPRAGSTAIGDVLMEKAGGFMITPRHGSLKDNSYDTEDTLKPTERLTFCVVRNPLDRMQSLYHYTKSDYPDVSFSEWLRLSYKPSWILQQQGYYAEHCDEVLRFESLQEDFNKLTGLHLPDHEPTNYGTMSAEDKALIKKHYASDFKNFGYGPKKKLTSKTKSV